MRGVFKSRPIKPRYSKIWDVAKVLKHVATRSLAQKLSLQFLTLKLVILCALVSGQRSQTLQAFNLKQCTISNSKVAFDIHTILKHSAPNKENVAIPLPAYPADERLCVVMYMKEYIKRTKHLRTSSQLFISFVNPRRPVITATISRRIKITLGKSGIDTDVFKGHSTRAASTSAVKRDVDLHTIMRTAGWSRASTFARFYNKSPIEDDCGLAFGKAVLRKSRK